MPHTSIILALYQIGAIQFGKFTLKSGQSTPIYINLRKIISYPKLLRSIASLFWEQIKDCQFDLICGVAYTALPIATCIALDHDIPMLICRKEKKDYGTKQRIEGQYKQDQRCLLIEDVMTTGSSLRETIKPLEEVSLQIEDIAVLIDRNQGGRQNLGVQYKLHVVLTLNELLTVLLKTKHLKDEESAIIEHYLAEQHLLC